MYKSFLDFILGVFRDIYCVFDIAFMNFPSLSILIIFFLCLFIVIGFLVNK